jgi:effector-binding domain-containing protein
MKLTTPTIDERAEQPYAGIRVSAPMSEFPNLIPQLIGETFGWLAEHGVAPAGPPLMRFHVINMNGDMDVEIGVPVASAVQGEGRVAASALPAGRYASLVYTGVENGIPGNAALLEWGAERGLVWDSYAAPNGDGFVSRYESFLMGPEDHPDPSQWDTEVAIRLADA